MSKGGQWGLVSFWSNNTIFLLVDCLRNAGERCCKSLVYVKWGSVCTFAVVILFVSYFILLFIAISLCQNQHNVFGRCICCDAFVSQGKFLRKREGEFSMVYEIVAQRVYGGEHIALQGVFKSNPVQLPEYLIYRVLWS
jgi:hypothetical protein